MTNARWSGRAIVRGVAEGPALVSLTPLSFLGDVDIRSGRVVEPSSDILDRPIGGCVLVIPRSRGSAGAWRFLYQLREHGVAPAAILTEELPDPSVVQGALLIGAPVVAGVAATIAAVVPDGARLTVRDGAVVVTEPRG